MCICVCVWYVRTNPERDILDEDKAALIEYNNSDDKSKVKTIKQHQDRLDTYNASGMALLHHYNSLCEDSKSSLAEEGSDSVGSQTTPAGTTGTPTPAVSKTESGLTEIEKTKQRVDKLKETLDVMMAGQWVRR